MTTVLVCGGRDFSDQQYMWALLEREHAKHKFARVIHGAARGADRMSGEWACQSGIPVTTFPADWAKHGKRAGPIRNQQMLDEGKPDLVIAFPGGAGTADMVRRAKAAAVPTVVVRFE